MSTNWTSVIRGCIVGGALGDAHGYQAEHNTPAPIISDDTQLTLFTLEALTELLDWTNQGVATDTSALLWISYLRWLRTQGELIPDGAPAPPRTWLETSPPMQRRHPGRATLTGLSSGIQGTARHPQNLTARGPGSLMRSAPFGLIPGIDADTIVTFALDGAALTHGHPAALAASAAFPVIIHQLALDTALPDAIDAGAQVSDNLEATDLASSLRTVASLKHDGDASAQPPLTDRFGPGKLADDILVLALACVAREHSGDPENADDASERFVNAVVHGTQVAEDKDTTAAVIGNLCGALYGERALPEAWLQETEDLDVVERAVDEFTRQAVDA